jgi:hypothetical protein
MTYVGNEELLRRHKATLVQFETNFASNNWETHNNDHFDWWAFPFDPGRPTASQGDRYNVPAADVELLRSSPEFLKSLARMVTIQMWSYGWDTENRKVLDVSSAELRQRQAQCTGHSVRLWKLGSSLITFGSHDEFSSVLKFVNHLGAEDHDGKISRSLLSMTTRWLGLITSQGQSQLR